MNEYENRLLARNIKLTSVRLLIFKAMVDFPQAFSLSDLETVLETVDKSTIFRTITLFHDNLLIHSIDDGSGSLKYSVCNDNCMCAINDLHLHFTCIHCHKTHCLESISIPEIKLPENFFPESMNFVVKGFCNQCAKFAQKRYK